MTLQNIILDLLQVPLPKKISRRFLSELNRILLGGQSCSIYYVKNITLGLSKQKTLILVSYY
jgi:hypothetical protein